MTEHQRNIINLEKIAKRKYDRLQEIAEEMDKIQFNTTEE